MLAINRIMFLESSPFTLALTFGAILLGLFAGSAAYAIAWRMTHGRPTLGASHCPECGHPLTFRQTVPLISWITQHGECAYCGKPISLAYPTCELMGAGIFGSIVFRYGISAQTVEILALSCVLMVIAITSLMDYSIRNSCILWAVAIRVAYLAYLAFNGEEFLGLAMASIAGVIALGVPLALAVFLSNAMLARDIHGFGTVKLVAVVGLYLGWQQGMIAIAGAVALGVLVWLVSPTKLVPVEVEGGADDGPTQMVSPRDLKPTFEEDVAEPMRLIPFAPSIVIACWIVLLLGVSLAAWNAPII